MNENKEKRSRKSWTKFCPKCGKQTDEFFESVCEDCFRAGITLLEPRDLDVSLGVCPHCGDYFKGKERTSIEAVVEDSIRRAISKKYGYGSALKIKVLRTELDDDERRARVSLVARADVSGVRIEEQDEITVVLKREICERCSRIAGGYYVGIVQIRADGRIPTEDELVTADDIAYSSLGEEDFVSKEQMLKEGLDIYVSSAEYGRRISRGIVKKLGGSFSESQKLYGRKDGRNIYRVSFAVRLPGFKPGEVVELGDKQITVENAVEGKGIEGVDKKTGERVLVSKKELMKSKRV